MKTKFFTIILSFLLFLSQKSFSQVTYPCGVYFLSLDGTSTNLGEWTNVYPTNDYTLAAWFQIRDSVWQGNEMDIFQRKVLSTGVSDYDDGLDLYIATNGELKYRAYTFKNGMATLDSLGSGVKPEPFKWCHVAVTFKSTGECNFYINGNLASSKTFGGAMSLNYPYLNYLAVGGKISFIGINNPTFGTFKGYLDELAVAEKAFTQDQVRTLANGLSAGDPFLKANNVDSYDKEDTYPGTSNLGIGGGNIGIRGQLHYCPAKLTTSIIDPNPSMILSDGSLSNDQSKINLNYVVKGATTDGITKLLLIANADSTTPITFSLPNPKDGILYSLDDQHTFTAKISITPKNGKAVCVYEVPDGYGINNLVGGRNIIVQAYYTSDQSHQTDISINLVTPPVVLVHGMWSDANAWIKAGFVNALTNSGYSLVASSNNPASIYLANYSQNSNATFDPVRYDSRPEIGQVNVQVTNAIKAYRNNKIAITQVDAIGLGLGGLMIRSYSQQNSFIQNDNYKRGYIHKLITIGTPHGGTPYGPTLWNHRNDKCYITSASIAIAKFLYYTYIKEDPEAAAKVLLDVVSGPLLTVGGLMSKIHRPIGTCHRDFGRDSISYKHLTQTYPFYSYSITGNSFTSVNYVTLNEGSTYNGMNNFFEYVAGLNFNQLYIVPPCLHLPANDWTVEINSQTGGIPQTNNFRGVAAPESGQDSTELNTTKVQAFVDTLLLSDDISLFSSGFPAPSQISADCVNGTDKVAMTEQIKESKVSSSLGGLPNGRIFGDSILSVQITSPINGSVYQNNSNIKLQFSVQGPVKPIASFFEIEDIGRFVISNHISYDTSFFLPSNIAMGRHNIVLFVRDTLGILFADTTSIIVTSEGILDSIAAYPGTVYLDSSGRTSSIYVQGYFSGGQPYNESDMTNGSAGTTYSSQKGNNIFKVSPNGLITAISPGTDTLIVSNGGLSIKVPVTVDSNFSLATIYPNTIDFQQVSSKSVTDPPFALSATSSSADTVSFTLVSGPVKLQNGVVVITGPGTVTIEATSPGDAYFSDATPVYRTFQITNALPLTLINFYGSLNSNKETVLNWGASQEINTSYFAIERSADGDNFSSIGHVNASGNNSSAKNYSFIDQQPLEGTNFYRLKMIDIDGKFTYSKIVAIRNDNSSPSFKIFPNPANEILYVQASGATDIATLQIFDASGRKLKEEEIVLNGNISYPINIKNLPKGVYDLLLKGKTINEHQKFVKQ